ncbi:MAG: hypothetical protein QGH85_01645 [Candidatus Pacebacteria bacterium]|jgi:hypothetical protein|nr:hypothetical protein [Candidatus Paceibacterota bacterium]MDP7466305.1 hypothetical protein [Candidatus Paceibacterota bacterium]
MKNILVIIVVMLFIVPVSFSSNSFAEENSETTLVSYIVSGNEYVLNYEIVERNDKTLLRAEVKQFIDLNNGDKASGEMVAVIALNSEMMKLVLRPEIKKSGDVVEANWSAMMRNGARIDGDYAVIDLDEVRITGLQFTPDDLIKMRK